MEILQDENNVKKGDCPCTSKEIVWKRIELSDRAIFEKYGSNKEGIAMFSFASMFFWKDYYDTQYAIVDGNIVAKGVSDDRRCVIYFPRGFENNVKECLEKIIALEKTECCKSIEFLPLTKEIAEKIEQNVERAKMSLIEGKCEYVYNQTDLSDLAGKKYHAKRNHIAKFDKNYSCEYINITEENIEILRSCAQYMFDTLENSPVDEFNAIMRAIDNFSALDLRACVITVDGKFAAYSIGSSINETTADIHFEKADRSYEGSYAKVNNCFAKYGWADKKYLNREEDLGIEGLRKAKLSYYPVMLNQLYKIDLL